MQGFGVKIGLAAGLLAAGFGATPAMAEKVKFEFWYGLSGDLGERVQYA